ncbi:MAG: hypothetical protein EXS36_19930 [Pedosphaera sp.]|nr:hypothetical protein [Pedosphaera sp.]
MIRLREDCLLVQQSSGQMVPCGVEQVTIELMGETVGLMDPEIIRDAAAGVLHFFKVELKKETVTLGEFAEALARVLRGFGVGVECMAVDKSTIAPPNSGLIEVEGGASSSLDAVADLREVATASGTEYELGFFPRLRGILGRSLQERLRTVRFVGLRGCVKQLMGRRRWCRHCRRMEEQIVGFLRESLRADDRSRGVLLLVH